MRRGSTRTVLLSLVVAACSSMPPASAASADAEPAPFVVLSWNVRYGTARDGADNWPLRREMLAAAIVAEAPHVLGVQEALADQLTFLDARLPHHRRLGEGRDGGARGEHAALYVDTTRFDVTASGTFWLSPTPDVVGSVGWDAALTRICTWASLRDRASERALTVWNVHFDHRGAEARLRSAELVVQRLQALPGPHVVLGDCNAGEEAAPLVALRAAGLRDTFRDLHPAARDVGTFHAFRGGSTGEKIDHVLVDAGLVTEGAAILSAPGANGRWPSDHHGVVAALRWCR